MAEFERVCKEWQRMHETVPNCNACPISLLNNKTGNNCYEFVRKFPEMAKEIIMKWSAENPIMTNGKKFEEVFGISGRDIVAINKLEWLEEEYKGDEKNGCD